MHHTKRNATNYYINQVQYGNDKICDEYDFSIKLIDRYIPGSDMLVFIFRVWNSIYYETEVLKKKIGV